VFGLGHVQSKNSIMHEQLLEQTLTKTEYGLGDQQAWRIVGRQGGCATTPTPHAVAAQVPPARANPSTTTTTG
jgi:hypothetical protein